MKTFINKSTLIKNEEGLILGYVDLVKVGLNKPPQGGWTPDEMRMCIKILDKLDNIELDSPVELEDAEYLSIFRTCSGLRWPFMHKNVVEFDDYLKQLSKE